MKDNKTMGDLEAREGAVQGIGDGWLLISDAPEGILGIVWTDEMRTRNDILGKVHTYSGGRREVVSNARGFTFTHWHPLPSPPSPAPNGSEGTR